MKKSKMVKIGLYRRIIKLVGKTDKKILAIWACDCAARVLRYFEKKYPCDKRPRLAIKAGRAWARTGVFHMTTIRKASLDAHAAARVAADDDAARSAARAAGQAAATAHVKTHSLAAAIYAASAVRDGGKPADADRAVEKEREWQEKYLRELLDCP
jgi:hypothetical protein